MSETVTNPYIGPRAFQRRETVYGRGREARQLFDLLTAERIVLLHAPSGAGKTSLAQAALIPLLEADQFFVPPVMRVNRLPLNTSLPPETNRYILSLLLYLDASLPVDAQRDEQELALLTFDDYLNERQELLTGGHNPVFVFDQFEECLTLDPYDLDTKQSFFAQLGTALRNRSRWALFSMRDDFVAGLEPYLRPLPTRLSNRFRLDLLDHAAAAEAIRKPAENLGVTFDPDAAAALIQDLSTVQAQKLDGQMETRVGPYVEPVQLQVVCRRLWARLAEAGRLQNGISTQDVAEMGAVSQALGGYYRDSVTAVAQQTKVSERQIREWVSNQLITEQGIRGQVLQTPKQSQGLKNQAIDLLVDTHLIRKEERRGALWYELAHDRLIEPVQVDNRLWREEHLSLLQTQAELWQRNGRNVGLLLTDETLATEELWVKDHLDEMTSLDHEFLLACRRRQNELLVEQQVQEQRLKAAQKEAEMQRQLQVEQLKAAEERAKTEQLIQAQKQAEIERKAQTRLAKVFRQAAAALSLLLLVAIVFAGIAVNRANAANEAQVTSEFNAQRAQAAATTANEERLRAEANSALALDNAATAGAAQATAQAEEARADAETTRAVNERATAEAERAIAEAQKANAEALALALRGSSVLDNNPELGILLALEASYITPAPQVVEILQKAVQRIPPSAELPDTQGADLLLSPDGQWLFARPANSPAVLWAMPDQDSVNAFQPPDDPVAWTFSPDSQYLAISFFAADLQHGVQIWQLQRTPYLSAELVYLLETEGTENVVAQLLWHDQAELFTGSNNGMVFAWNLDSVTTPAPTATNELNSPTPDTGEPIQYDQTSARLLTQLPENEPVSLLHQDDAGNWIAVTGIYRQTVVAWSRATNSARTYSLLNNETISIVNLATGYDGSPMLFLGGQQGQARIIRLEQDEVVNLTGHTAEIAAAVFNYDRYYFVTASTEGLIQWWSTTPLLELLDSFDCSAPGSIQLAFFPGQDALASICADGLIEVRPRSANLPTYSFNTSSTINTRQLFIAPDGDALLIRPENANARWWFLEAGITLEGHTNFVDGLVFQSGISDEYRLMSTSLDQTFRFWDFTAEITSGIYTSRTIALSPEQMPVRTNLIWHPDTDLFAYFAQDGQVHLWSVVGDEAQELLTLPGVISDTVDSYNQIYTLAFSPDGSLLATKSDKGQVNLWRVSDLRAASTTAITQSLKILDDKLAGTVFDLSFSADNTRLAVLKADQVTLWDISIPEQATILTHIPEFGGTVSAAFLHPDGRFLFTGDRLGQIQVWDLQELAEGGEVQLRQSLIDHQGMVWVFALTGDGNVLATSSADGSVILWQVTTEPGSDQDVLTKIRLLYEDVTSHGYMITFSPDQQWLALADDLGTIHLLAAGITDASNLSNLACNRVGRNLRYDEWELYIGPVWRDGEFSYRQTCAEYPVHESILTTLLARSESLAEQGRLDEAVTLLNLVVGLDTTEILAATIRDNPQTYLEQIYVTKLMAEGDTLALAGQVDRALEQFTAAITQNPALVPPELLTDPQIYAWTQALVGLQNGYIALNQEDRVTMMLTVLQEIEQTRPDLLPEPMRLDPERYLLVRAIDSLLYAGGEGNLTLAQQYALQLEDSYWSYRVCDNGVYFGQVEIVAEACEAVRSLAQPLTNEELVTGLVEPGGGQTWQLTATIAETITIQLRPLTVDNTPSLFYPTITFLSPENTLLYVSQYQDFGPHGIRSTYILPEPGEYTLLITGAYPLSGNDYGAYEMVVWDETQSQLLAEVDGLVVAGEALAREGDSAGAVGLLTEAANLLPGAVSPRLRTNPEQYVQQLRADTLVEEGLILASNGDVDGAVARWNEAIALSPDFVTPEILADPQAHAVSLAFTNWITALQIAVTQENGAAAATELLANILTQLTEVNDGYLYFQLCSLQPTFAPYPTLVEQLDDVCERMVTLARPLSASQVVTGQVVVGSGELWRFEGEEGQIITIEMQAVITGTQTTRLDTYLYLVGQNGTGLGYNDDFGGEPALPFSTDSRIVVTLPEDGVYIIVAAGYSLSYGTYQLRFEVTAPTP